MKKAKNARKETAANGECRSTLAFVLGIITCAPFSINASVAEIDGETVAAADSDTVAAASYAPFGELSDGRYTLESLDYQLTEDFAAEGYIYVPGAIYATIDLNGFTIDRGLTAASATGYVIKVDGSLTITDSSGNNTGTITGGYAEQGGAVYNNCALTIEGGTITGNRAGGDGGAIYSTGNLYIDGGVISSNTAKNSGGAIVVADGTAEIYGGTIAYNTAQEYHGGAIYNGADLHIYGGSMTQNYAKLQGGAVLNNGTLTVSGGTITDNCAENNGGVYVPMAARSKCTMTP